MKSCTQCGMACEETVVACPRCGTEFKVEVEPVVGPVEPEKQDDSMNTHSSPIIDSISAVPIIKESIVDGTTVHTGRLLVSVADRTNRNNRVYPRSVWQREAAASRQKVERGTLTGQAEHPAGRPDLLDTILKFTGIEYEEATGNVYAPFTVIPTAKGRDFIEIAKAGVAVGCSTRGTGSVKREKRGSGEVAVIQDDYDLQGIDVMLFGEQSVESAMLMQFEHIEPDTTESQPMSDTIVSLDALREAYPDLLTEAEKPLAEKLALSEQSLSETAALLETTKQEAAALREANEKLQERVNEAVSKRDAVAHLMEVARDQKQAAWLVVEFLKDCPSAASVDESLPAAVKKAEALIETTLVHGQGVMVAQPNDDNKAPDQTSVQYPSALSVATGTRIR